MKAKWIFNVLILLLGIALITACSAAEDGDPGDQTPPADTEEPAGDAAPGEEVADTELIQLGEEVARAACIGCHGQDLNGGPAGPSLVGLGDQYSTDELIDIVTNGKGTMPGGLANGNEEAVVAYLLTLE